MTTLISNALLLVGLVLVSVAAFVVHLAAGLAVSGAACVFVSNRMAL